MERRNQLRERLRLLHSKGRIRNQAEAEAAEHLVTTVLPSTRAAGARLR